MKKVGVNSLQFDNVYLKSFATSCGPMEAKGPLGEYFDRVHQDAHCNQKSWEKAEMTLIDDAIKLAMHKSGLVTTDLDLIVGGDLNNQLAPTNYVLRSYEVPYIGVYSACSTFTGSLITACSFLDGGYGRNILSITSSHNATSERQFRYPTEYGGQKPESMTFTATGAGASIVSSDFSLIKITKATIGQVIDLNQSDPQDMGRAMAPAASMTLKQHLEDFNITPDDYDLIVTGDLSYFGKKAFLKIVSEFGITINDNYNDCGLMLYDIEKQDVFAGGSGCGCSTLVTLGYLTRALLTEKYHKVLIIATGALLNPIMIAQKESIPCIAHAIVLERSQF